MKENEVNKKNIFVSKGTHTGTTIPISAASSQPAILPTSVEQSAQVSQTQTH